MPLISHGWGAVALELQTIADSIQPAGRWIESSAMARAWAADADPEVKPLEVRWRHLPAPCRLAERPSCQWNV